MCLYFIGFIENDYWYLCVTRSHQICTWFYFINRQKIKGFLSLQPDWSEKYNKHIELSFVWFILKVFQRHKRNHNFYSSACQHIFYVRKCVFIIFWFVLVIEIRKKYWMRKLLSDTLIRACNNWLIMRAGPFGAINFENL